MMMKYLCIQGKVDVSPVFNFLHVPVDQHILKAVKEKLLIHRICPAWSKIDNYKVYLDYQKKIREKIQIESKKAPLRWEMSSWIEEMEHTDGDI